MEVNKIHFYLSLAGCLITTTLIAYNMHYISLAVWQKIVKGGEDWPAKDLYICNDKAQIAYVANKAETLSVADNEF